MRLALLALLLVVGCGDNFKRAPEDAGADTNTLPCGNGVVEGAEDCDDGPNNGTEGARCTTTCNWVCLDDSWCADTETCNGIEKCVDHACIAGTTEPEGASCGAGKLCRSGQCTDAVCGDQFVTGPSEECDDANSTAGDGCETTCKFSCVSTDATRDCTPADACAGPSACDDTTHMCSPSTPLANDTPCNGGSGYCKDGTCTTPMCSNGITEPGEDCDLGSANGTMGSGCKADCTFECVNPANDCPTAAACQKQSCNNSHACASVADTAQDGDPCGTNLVCSNGACVAPTAVCGNSVTETGEDCDFGNGNGAGTGCESNCTFSCTTMPDTCNDNNPCNGTETCGPVTVSGHAGQKCSTTAAPAPGTTCGSGKVCNNSQLCVTSSCGDGLIDTTGGEQCDPPNGTSCSATCKNIVCGDGVRAGLEQCDDGNTTNLDGCDGTCKFEQCHRVNSLSLVMPPAAITSALCTKNALGGALTGTIVQNTLSNAINGGVSNGSITIEIKASGLDDLLGNNDSNLSLGVLTGSPVSGANYNGNSDLDWWYTTSPSVIDATRNPTTSMSASISTKALTAGPSDITITINLAGAPATLNMLRAKLKGNIGNASVPTTSTGTTPGHLTSEHLDPTLQSFASIAQGELCGDITAGSLDLVPAPDELAICGFDSSHTMLDVIVAGCIFGITGTQPDGGRVPGDTYKFTRSGKKIISCTKNNQSVALSTCMSDATFSSFFKFTTDRVIAK